MNDLAIWIKLPLWLAGAALSLYGVVLIVFYPGVFALVGLVLLIAGIVLCRKLTDDR